MRVFIFFRYLIVFFGLIFALSGCNSEQAFLNSSNNNGGGDPNSGGDLIPEPEVYQLTLSSDNTKLSLGQEQELVLTVTSSTGEVHDNIDASQIIWSIDNNHFNTSGVGKRINLTPIASGDDIEISAQVNYSGQILSDSISFSITGNEVMAWGYVCYGGALLREIKDVKELFHNNHTFVALKYNGTIEAWNDCATSSIDVGGEIPDNIDATNVKAVYATLSAFAALREDGTVFTWGDPNAGGNSESVASKLVDIKEIYPSSYAFAALTNDGKVVTWGDPNSGGDSRSVEPLLVNVNKIFSYNPMGYHIYPEPKHCVGNLNLTTPPGCTFAALKNDGKVVVWGSPDRGGDNTNTLVAGLTDIKDITVGPYSSAFLTKDNTVVSQGTGAWEIDSATQAELHDVTAIYAGGRGFTALREGGSVVYWGYPRSGREAPESNNIHKVINNNADFAGFTDDGVAFIWGYSSDSIPSSSELLNVKNIYKTEESMAVLRNDGSVVYWGYLPTAIPSIVNKTDVSEIYSTGRNYMAIKMDGSIDCWGDCAISGNSRIPTDFSKVKSIVTTYAAYAAIVEE